MMKKAYQKPTLKLRAIVTEGMIATSLPVDNKPAGDPDYQGSKENTFSFEDDDSPAGGSSTSNSIWE